MRLPIGSAPDGAINQHNWKRKVTNWTFEIVEDLSYDVRIIWAEVIHEGTKYYQFITIDSQYAKPFPNDDEDLDYIWCQARKLIEEERI